MNSFFKCLVLLSISIFLVQCQPDTVTVSPMENPEQNQGIATDTINVNENIASDQTWTTGNTYILNDLVSVVENATLTIEPGVLVKAAPGATGLVITKGSKIDAQGTATQPIIFTALEDMIVPGEILSPNLSSTDVKLWSGLFILGCAPVSASTEPAQYPLLPEDAMFQYGGPIDTDNSGTLSYVSIRHTGYEVVVEETPSGLNLGGVGNGTTISHVELVGNQDDALVLDGGTVNLDNIVSVFYKDDGLDCDRGWSGGIDNVIGVSSGTFDAAIELDGGEGASNPSFTISNASFKGNAGANDYILFRQGVNCFLENIYFFNFDEDSEVKLLEDTDADNWINSLIDMASVEINTTHLIQGNTTIDSIFVDHGEDDSDAFVVRTPDASIVSGATVGADKAAFADWTVADLSGELEGF